jgi:hypothetical protein
MTKKEKNTEAIGETDFLKEYKEGLKDIDERKIGK